MVVKFSDKAKQWKEGYYLLERATEHLEEILGPSAGSVSVEWDRREDARGRSQYIVKLSDHTGEVTDAFAPSELELRSHMRYRLLDLWGKLLQRRSDEQMKKLQELVKEGG
ncbi:MAG: hypothetical protein JO112_03990 [Planctomycetes bacterium]|nr:hypothetical protein [Planctomycetota bacterium]